MATYNVSNSSQLKSALSKANGGDTINLAGGSYGSLSLSGKGGVTIKGNGDAKFSAMTLRGASKVTIDNVKFSGGGMGLKADGGSNLKVTNCDFSGLGIGASFLHITGLTVSNNDFTSLSTDAMRFAGISNAVISGNKYVEKGSAAGSSHKDFIQFWGNGDGPSKNVKIAGNEFYSSDGLTHGIFMNSGVFSNITIEKNYLKSSHTHGITVSKGVDLDILYNTLIPAKTGKSVYYPLINVSRDSQDVKIVGNTAPSVPNAANSSWTVSGNKETGGGTHWSGSARSATTSAATLAEDDGTAGSGILSGAGADRFDFDKVSGGDRIDLGGIDANVTADGNQAFHFDGTGKGDLSLVDLSNGNTLVRGNVDGDDAFEFRLVIEDGAVKASAYEAADFIL